MLVEEHTPWVLARISGKIGSRDGAEDLLQEVFLAAFLHRARLRDPERFGAWLCSIADNHVRMWQRRRIAQLNFLDRLETEPEPASSDEREIRALVRRALGRLSEDHRAVIVHHYLKGYSYRHTADLLQVGAGTVRSRLQKARKRLEKEIVAMSNAEITQTFELGAVDLAGMRHAARFCSDDPQRAILQVVCLDAGGRIVATDGSRLLNWSSPGLASLGAPVILDSLTADAVPDADSATLLLDEKTATLRTSAAQDVKIPLTPGPYVKYEKAVGTPGSICATLKSDDLMACVEGIEPFMGAAHEFENDRELEYTPLVEMRVSSGDGQLSLRTTRDQGFRYIEEGSGRAWRKGPDWAHSVRCPVAVTGIEEEGSFAAGMNCEFLKTIAAALMEASSEIQIRLADSLSALNFDAGEGEHHAVLMPMRMAS